VISLIFLLGFLYIFCAAALFVNVRKNWMLRRLKRTYPDEDYSNSTGQKSFPDSKNRGAKGCKKLGLSNSKNRRHKMHEF